MNSLIFLLIPIYIGANRMAGDGRWLRALGWHGRPLWYAAVAAFIIAIPFAGMDTAGLSAVSFLLWRTLGWYNAIDAGTHEGTRAGDFAVISARGLLLFPAFFIESNQVIGAISLLVCCFGIGCAYDLSWRTFKFKDPIPAAELMVGAWIGLWFAIMGMN